MIEYIKVYIEQIIYVAILVLMLELILPKGNTKKHIGVAISLVVLLNIISPVFKILSSGNMTNILAGVEETISSNTVIKNDEVQDFGKYKNFVVTNDVEEKLEADIKQKVHNIGVRVEKISISLTEEYTFKKIKIYVDPIDLINDKKLSKISEIIYLVSDEYGIDTGNIEIIEEGT